MLKRRSVNAAAMLADLEAQIREGYTVKVAEFIKDRAASYATNPELIAGMAALLADAIIDPPKIEGRRRSIPRHGTMSVTVNGGEPVVSDPYVSTRTATRVIIDSLQEKAALSYYNFLVAARELLAGREVLPYFDGEQRELTKKTARAALAAAKLNDIDGRSFKRRARERVCKKHRISHEKLTELTS